MSKVFINPCFSMKIRRFFFAAVSLICAISAGQLSAGVAKVGQPAPKFTLTDITGKTHQLGDYQGKTVVLEWVNPECPFVVKHYRSGNMQGLQDAAAKDGVIWLAINSGRPGAQGDFKPEKAQNWTQRVDAAFTSYLRDSSGKVGRSYGAKTTPHMFVINPEGVLVYDGAIDSIASTRDRDITRAENYVEKALAAVRSGELPAKSKSRPYGCSVKY